MRSFNGQPSIVSRTWTRTVPALDLDVLQHADVLDRLADLGIQHASERLADLLLRWPRRPSGLPAYPMVAPYDTVLTVEIQSYDRVADHARARTDRGPQGARRRHAVPAVPIPAAVGPAGVGPRAVDPPVAAPEHPAPASPPPGGGGPGGERDPPGAAAVGRPQMLYTAVDVEAREGRDYRLLAEILAGLSRGKRQRGPGRGARPRVGRVPGGAQRPEAGCAATVRPEPRDAPGGARRGGVRRRGSGARARKTVEITLRDCPFRDLLDEHRDLVCAVHRGLLEGMLARLAALAPADGVRTAGRTHQRLPAGRAGGLTGPLRSPPARPRLPPRKIGTEVGRSLDDE